MTNAHILVGTSAARPVVRRISPSDLYQSLARGVDDFVAMPSHAVFLCVIYPLFGIFLIGMTLGHATLPLAFPLAAGFALVGPIAAIGLYELSRRREAGLDSSSSHAFDVLHSPSLGAIVALGLLLMAIFLIWLAVADAIYVANFGYAAPTSLRQFADQVFDTLGGMDADFCRHRRGIPVRGAGADDQRDLVPAVARSRRRRRGGAPHLDPRRRREPGDDGAVGPDRCRTACRRLDSVSARLTVVMPVLGHATWHLYRRAVEPDPNPREDYKPRERPRRSAADFPAALFPTRR